jgi:hypothetical protein
MKINMMAMMFALLSVFTARAELISFEPDQSTYNTGSLITVDVFINDANPDIDFISFEYIFAEPLFSFDSFLFETIIEDSFDQIDYFDAYIENDVFIIELGFLLDWSKVLGTSFKIGQAFFVAEQDDVSFSLTEDVSIVEDSDGNPIQQQL